MSAFITLCFGIYGAFTDSFMFINESSCFIQVKSNFFFIVREIKNDIDLNNLFSFIFLNYYFYKKRIAILLWNE